MVNQLSLQVQSLSQAAAAARSTANATAAAAAANPPDIGSAGSNVLPSQIGGPAAPGQSLPPNPATSPRFNQPATLEDRHGAVKFGPGFEIRSDDDEFYFQFHDLTQVDYRGYNPSGESPVHDTFDMPRQWFMFAGRVTRPIGYFVSLAHAFDTVSMLDAFIDLSYDSRLQFRAGRFKTPFTYEFLVEPVQGLIMPERSVFFNNFGQNRDVGTMFYGRLFNKIDYATGVFNGTRNGYLAQLDTKAFSGFVNYKPFNDWKSSFLENFNIGFSTFAGSHYNTVPNPPVLRTTVPTSGSSVIGVPFLTFNSNARETGLYAFWDMHVAYFYRQLAVIGEWGSGFQDYALSNALTQKTHLPVGAFYVQAGYLLTGETRSGTGVVKPKRPFNLKRGAFGPGAWELTSRFQYIDIGSQVFTNGLADPNYNANRVNLIDVGFNWHLTQYLKFYFMWEHADFNQPVLYAPGKQSINNNQVIARIQLFF
jgi:phosphate-selective porin OprO/OprP